MSTVNLHFARTRCECERRLRRHHADPFDRLLVAIATENDWRIATRDQWIGKYDVPVLAC